MMEQSLVPRHSEKEKEIAGEQQLEERDEEDGVIGIQDEEDQVDHEQVVEEYSALVPVVSCLALYSASQRYLPDAAGYECPPRTVDYISQHETQCAFCALTSFCLLHINLERVPKSGAFTVTSLGLTAGSGVKDLGEGVLEEAQNTTALDGAHNNGYMRTLFTVCEAADKNDLYYFLAETDQDTVMNSGHEVSAPSNISPKRLPALEDSRLNESARDRTYDEDSDADGTIMAAEEWRLSLMCIEWLDVPSGAGGTGEGKKKETMKRVARRLDVVRYGPSVRTWLDLGPERVNVALI
ncbi:hypothetical protein E2P81_ATG09137 [Venturia nashicola]|nr:hypothetical protein E2P81_ATG09137 [Venturia nashicola]